MTDMYCVGCGASIQSINPDEPGYAPQSVLNRDDILCKRCFRLKHYNEVAPVSMDDQDFFNMVSQIRDQDGLIVHIIDIFDADGTIIDGLSRIIGENKRILLAANKIDLLPKSLNHNNVVKWLRGAAKQAGITVEGVYLISSVQRIGISDLSAAIERERNGQDVYIVGATNVGKSTFINDLIQHTTGNKNVITTSYFPGTTLGFIEIPLDENTALIDTPGVINKQQIAQYITQYDLKIITPEKEIKPRVFQLNEQQTLYIGGLARLDFIKGDRESFVCYFANDLNIHRTKLENADTLLANHRGKLLSPPDEESMEMLPEFISKTHKLTQGKTDVVFPGLGWIAVSGGDVTVEVHTPKGFETSLRRSLI